VTSQLDQSLLGFAAGSVEKLDHLGDLLGEEHDLSMIETVLEGEAPVEPNTKVRIVELLRETQGRLRAQAKALGKQLFVEDVDAFAGRLRQAFDTFRASAS
jgi:hypothetical protein